MTNERTSGTTQTDHGSGAGRRRLPHTALAGCDSCRAVDAAAGGGYRCRESDAFRCGGVLPAAGRSPLARRSRVRRKCDRRAAGDGA
ncbi:MAG: hypothetical protein L6W00_11535 [Lentisphaeria bacterium]|nr:MAG: hypothetical protein L6W00_11535 [Lentisphaeria bacterium]